MINIWTNGCFDILHIGHIELFKYAKSLGDKLIVGIDSDNRIKQLKGKNRPINTQQYRLLLLKSIRYIDDVVIFDTDQALREHIKKFHIAKIVIGDDYISKKVIGDDLASIIFFPKIPNISTTILLNNECSTTDT